MTTSNEQSHGRTALVTGSAKGLGKMTALMLARAGYHIALNYVRSEQEALALREQIRALGVRCEAYQADIAVPEQVTDMMQRLAADFGGADVVVNNAGPFVRERRRFVEYDFSEVDALVRGNLLGVMQVDLLALPYMRERGWGRLIHFGFGRSSEARGWPHRAAYAAAKVGLVSFTKTLAVEEAEFGITVNMVCPGDIKGAFKEQAIVDVVDQLDPESPRGRPGTGEDVSRVISFLCEEQSDFVTGNIIDISGGLDPIRTFPMRRD
jgi:3-oxoacyl-[acyl-carrier protein] reductase